MKHFSNIHKLKREATSNLNDFQRAQNIYNTIMEKEKLYSNLEYANGIISTMLEDQDIKQNDLNHQILTKSLDNMTTIYSKTNLNTMDIDSFYTSYKGIIDINNKVRGEKND